ncbi:hypothetical protein K474DRAFT_1681400 [Panus rudis PR-1116 ss-1]|nr:hypothetical protein K474DRAFT_1681400 [Panus rudis PR-1116 ss-1]
MAALIFPTLVVRKTAYKQQTSEGAACNIMEVETSHNTVIAPLSAQQEDAVIHTRIMNDEKALRRVTRKFHTWSSVAYNPDDLPPSVATSVDDARDAFLVELASFHLSLKKSMMVVEAEARQVEEYQRERERIAREHGSLQEQIEDLKVALEQAQLERKRKMEYDIIAEKINNYPTRAELEQSIRSLENDMVTIRAEHENQDRTLQAQKTRLDMVISDLSELRLMGKADMVDTEESRAVTPATNEHVRASDSADVDMSDARRRAESGELKEGKDDGKESEEDVPLSKAVLLNPSAQPFIPTQSRTGTPVLDASHSNNIQAISIKSSKEEGEEDEDVEMGELSEDPKKKKKAVEDLEEGEASDFSSELSEPPDD